MYTLTKLILINIKRTKDIKKILYLSERNIEKLIIKKKSRR